MNKHTKTERVHSLDALRATMMLLGIVLHSTETYSTGYDSIWPHDPNSTNGLMNYLNSLIHLFRMPIFFLIAGFFGALLFYERGSRSMLKNRVRRLLLPFIAFLLILHPIVILSMQNTVAIFGVKVDEVVTTLTAFPQITYHLWFLYYLILITAFCYLLALGMRRLPRLSGSVKRAFEWLLTHRLVFTLIFSIIIFALLVWMWEYWAPTPLYFGPEVNVFIFYTLFYLLGWLLYKSRQLLPRFLKHDRLLVSIGLVVFTLKYIYIDAIGDIAYGALNAMLIWCFIFGITGLFMRYFGKYSHQSRYISDSSYWVYLVHLPLTIFIPGLIAHWPVPTLVKFVTVMLSTSLICFLSYHYLVRGTFIGAFLNGRKYPIGKVRRLQP